MSGGVKIFTPSVRLAKLLQAPGGLPVTVAVARSGERLEGLKRQCAAELEAALEQAETCAARARNGYDAVVVNELYEIVSRPIGVASVSGLDAVDTVLISLADLVDYLKGQECWDAEAIAVHLAAFRLLLRAPASDKAGAEVILAGLRKVTQRYAR
ncbi:MULTISPECIES: hypothetical protein [Phenylobacterium]|uniref:Chemotaxis protein CheE n=1 Tax=Phenylobacterium koreense TaxID=266125 RepID=A0ABV2EGA5_9CAUL